MEAKLVDVSPEESKETDSMFEDYLKGFNEGIGKLMDKEKPPAKVQEKGNDETTEKNKRAIEKANNKSTEEARNENLVVLIDHSENGMDNNTDERKEIINTDEQYGEFQSNSQKVDSVKQKKTNIKRFIDTMEEINEKMDKLVEKDIKHAIQKKIEHEIKEKIGVTKLVDQSGQVDETTTLINIETNNEENDKIKDNDKKEDSANNTVGDNTTETTDNKIKENLSDTLSNLTVLEQTHTLEEYHKRFEKKCKKEMKALEEIDLDEMETHGVHECTADLHEDQYNSVPYEYQNYM